MLGVFLAMFEFIFGRVWGVFGMSEVFLAMSKVFLAILGLFLAILYVKHHHVLWTGKIHYLNRFAPEKNHHALLATKVADLKPTLAKKC